MTSISLMLNKFENVEKIPDIFMNMNFEKILIENI